MLFVALLVRFLIFFLHTGVFLFMGVSSLDGLQFFDRILLFLMPKKFQPDYPYLRQVQLGRVHLYTMIQIGCFVALWIIKSMKQTSILFPLMVTQSILFLQQFKKSISVGCDCLHPEAFGSCFHKERTPSTRRYAP